jgi:hypothetical protein
MKARRLGLSLASQFGPQAQLRRAHLRLGDFTSSKQSRHCEIFYHIMHPFIDIRRVPPSPATTWPASAATGSWAASQLLEMLM